MFEEKKIVKEILKGYQLDPFGSHGVYHWARVYENGAKLADMCGGDVEVAQLFSLFHDSRRQNEYDDDEHGKRGAELAKILRGKVFDIDDKKFDLLLKACALHNLGLKEGETTILVCWDSDRLDLGRIGIKPLPQKLCTDAAREILPFADKKARENFKPDEILKRWGLI